MQLISPSNAFKQSFKHFYSDLEQSAPERAEYYQESQINFESYVQRLANEEKGINRKPNYVPCSHFWFVDLHNQILGCLRIRHNLGNDFLLIEAGLETRGRPVCTTFFQKPHTIKFNTEHPTWNVRTHLTWEGLYIALWNFANIFGP